MKSRTYNSIRNTVVALAGQFVTIFLSFLGRTLFIRQLGASYLGINGLFTNILYVLSFAELGFGTAIAYELYKPLADNDVKRIAALMQFYSRIYKTVGIFIFVTGACLIPFLDFFIGDISELPSDIPPLWMIYILYLLNSSVSYFFNYKRTIIIASQNGYIDSLNTMIFNVLRNVFQIAILFVWRAFVPYLLIQIVCTILGNVFISVKADKMFPYLEEYKSEKLDRPSVNGILRNVFAMACHKIGSVIVSGTDNILISKFVGVVATGYYSNYTLITSTVRTFYIQLFTSVTASVGNYVAEKSKEDSFAFFRRMFFVNAYIAIFCTSCLSTLINPFISMLWGDEYILPRVSVFFIMVNFYITCMRQTSCIYIDTNGLFWQVKWKSVIESFINLFASIALANYMHWGILGVIVGTTISSLCTNWWWEPYVVFKYALDSSMWIYWKMYGFYTTVLLISIAFSFVLENSLSYGVLAFIIRCLISVALPNLLMFLLLRKTSEYKYFLSLLNNKMKKTK